MVEFMYILALFGGVALLFAGGEMLIRGAVSTAKWLEISPLLTGLFVVGFGTSTPELVVSVEAALAGNSDIAVGNVVGSNIGNALLILGICALITPLAVSPLALKRDGVLGLGASALFVLLVGGSALVRFDAAILLISFTCYLALAWWTERQSSAVLTPSTLSLGQTSRSRSQIVFKVLGGLLLLILGSRVLLYGATGMATFLGVSEALIGLTLVAVGTSLPELTISALAAWRGQADVAVGNILGSNLFNLLGILGLSALLQPLPINERILLFDQWVLLASSLLLLVFLYTGRRLSRLEGGFLLLCYTAYLWVGGRHFSST